METKSLPAEENTHLLAEGSLNDEQSTVICENCHTEVEGSFCSQCGQSVESTLKYFWTVILHLLDDIFSFDSRASRTLYPLMFKPGFLTNEYFAGRRVHYVPPLRLYLFISIIFFIILKFFVDNTVIDDNQMKLYDELASEHISNISSKRETLLSKGNPIKAAELEESIEKFTQYKQYLKDSSDPLYPKVVGDIIRLEVRQYKRDTPLKEKNQEKLATAHLQLQKLLNGEKVVLSEDQVEKLTFSNNEDGTLTFDFLSKEANDKLNEATESLEEKSKKALANGYGSLFTEAIGKMPQLMFVLLPIFALLLKVMFLFSKRLYLEHLTVALHSHSFIFFAFMLIETFSTVSEKLTVSHPNTASVFVALSTIGLIWVPVYLFIMQKRVYKQGYILTTIKFFVISNLYLILIVFTALSAFLWGLASVDV